MARLLLAVIGSAIVSPPACARMRELLSRSLDAASRAEDPENQVDGFLGEGLPPGAQLWSKAGWMSQARHDAAYVEWPANQGAGPLVAAKAGGPAAAEQQLNASLLVVFSEGQQCAQDNSLLPEIARHLLQA